MLWQRERRTIRRQPHCLYRFFNSNGDLLYVGITNSLPLRLEQHNDAKPWWTEVSHARIQHYDDRSSVLVAEKSAIETEFPFYNIQHSLRTRRFMPHKHTTPKRHYWISPRTRRRWKRNAYTFGTIIGLIYVAYLYYN